LEALPQLSIDDGKGISTTPSENSSHDEHDRLKLVILPSLTTCPPGPSSTSASIGHNESARSFYALKVGEILDGQVRKQLLGNTPCKPFRSFLYRRSLVRRVCLCFLVLAFIAMTARLSAVAVESPQKHRPRAASIPLPPARPAQIGVDTPAPIPAPVVNPTQPALPSTQTAETPATPRSLPPASRTRMHECGLEWQKMKETGAAANQIWFDFARLCLTK